MGYAAGFQVYAPVIAKNDLGGADSYGLIVGAFGLGAIVGGLLMLRLSPARPMITASVGILVAILLFVAMAAAAPLWIVLAAAVASGIGLETFSVLWSTTLQAHIPDELLSRVSAYDFLGSLALTPIGAAVAGPLAIGLGGLHPAMWVAVAAMAVPTLLVLAVPDLWRLRGPGQYDVTIEGPRLTPASGGQG
jgi:MFS family permease